MTQLEYLYYQDLSENIHQRYKTTADIDKNLTVALADINRLNDALTNLLDEVSHTMRCDPVNKIMSNN